MWNSRKCDISFVPELAYICGVYFGDGSVIDTGMKCYFSLSTIDADFAEYTRSCFSKFVGDITEGITRYVDKRPGRSKLYLLRVHATDFCREIAGMCENKTKLPEFIFSHYTLKQAFVEGFFDSEGWVAKSKTPINNPASKYHGRHVYRAGIGCTNPLTIDIGHMMLELGLKVNNLHTNVIPSGKTFYRWFINMDSLADSKFVSHIRRKQERIDAYRLIKLSSETTK